MVSRISFINSITGGMVNKSTSGMIFYTRTSLDKNSTIRPQLRSFKNFIFHPFFGEVLAQKKTQTWKTQRNWKALISKNHLPLGAFFVAPPKKYWQFTLPYSLNSASFMSYKFLSTTHQDLHFRPRCMTNCHDKWAVCEKKTYDCSKLVGLKTGEFT